MIYLNSIIEEIKKYWIGFIPVALLILVSANQINLYQSDYLNRWKGGGFGMFSTINERYYHIHLIYNDTLECAEPHSDYGNELYKITNYPNYLALETLTKKLTSHVWIYTYGMDKKKPTSVQMIGKSDSLKANDKIANFDSVEIQVFDMAFNKETFTAEPRLLRKMRYLK